MNCNKRNIMKSLKTRQNSNIWEQQ